MKLPIFYFMKNKIKKRIKINLYVNNIITYDLFKNIKLFKIFN